MKPLVTVSTFKRYPLKNCENKNRHKPHVHVKAIGEGNRGVIGYWCPGVDG